MQCSACSPPRPSRSLRGLGGVADRGQPLHCRAAAYVGVDARRARARARERVRAQGRSATRLALWYHVAHRCCAPPGDSPSGSKARKRKEKTWVRTPVG